MDIEFIEEICKDIFNELGSGLIELNYHRALEYELRNRGEPYTSQRVVQYRYKEQPLSFGLMDLYLPNRKLIIELKALSTGLGHKEISQVRNYIKHSEEDCLKGMVINFGKKLDIIYVNPVPTMLEDGASSD